MKKLLPTLIISMLFNTAVIGKEKVDVTLLATSDLHGVFVPWDYSSDSANLIGSLSQIATKIKEIRAEKSNVLLIDVGDSIQGNFVETFKDQDISPMMLGFNALNYDIWNLGNHEFDFGLEILERSIKQFKGAVLGANIYRDDGSRFLPAYKLIDVDGVKIAFIGVTTPMVAEFAQGTDRLKTLSFTNPTQEVKKVLAELAGKVDAFILVSHMGLHNENEHPDTGNTDIANNNPALDAIIAGHMHVGIAKEIVNGIIITEPAKYGQALSRIDLRFEKNDTGYQLVYKDSYVYDIKGLQSDKELEAIYEPYHKILRDNANKPIAKLTGINLVPDTQVKGIPQVQIQDSGISALYHEASLHFAPKANVIAIQIDNDFAQLDIGDIRVKDIAYNYTYKAGEITVYQLTGQELKTYMEWAVDYFNQVNDGDVTYSFNPIRRSSKYSTNDFFGNVTYLVDLTQPTGQRINELKFANGTSITDTTAIRLGMNDYRMAHLTQKGGALEGQSFPILAVSKTDYGEDDGTIRNMTIRYLSEVKKGQYEGKLMSRWKLVELQGYMKERAIIEQLLNDDKIRVPVSTDGRYSNIASINVKDKLFADKKAYEEALQAQQEALNRAASDAERKSFADAITMIKALNKY